MESSQLDGGADQPGPAMQWLLEFERSRLPRVKLLLAGQLFAAVLLSCSSLMARALLSMTVMQHQMQGQPAVPPDAWKLLYATPLIWLVLLFLIRMEAVRNWLPAYGRMLTEHNPLQGVLGAQLVTGGDGKSFRKRLEEVMRSLPRHIRALPEPAPEHGAAALAVLVGGALLVAGWAWYLHETLGVWLENVVLGLLLLLMLVNFRTALARVLSELACARMLLGSLDEAEQSE